MSDSAALAVDMRGITRQFPGVLANDHVDFRVQHGDLLKELQVESLAGLIAEGLVTLETAAQDGMRVRASAGSSSFRRQPSLEEAQREAREHLDKLERESEADAAGQTVRQQKARERAARERLERVGKAIEAGVDMIELDCQLTRDGAVVVTFFFPQPGSATSSRPRAMTRARRKAPPG